VDYQFVLEDGNAYPDPRSPWQPLGVHGPSRSLDHSRFAWTDQRWQAPPLSEAIIYELHIGTFTPEGTFVAAIEKLDDLAALGITHIEIMPVAEFPGQRGWGYDGVDPYAPHHAYGGPDGLKRLVDACHAKGIAVILDVVYNHLGPDGNYLGKFGPYFTGQHRTTWGDAINFDGPGSDEVRRFFIDNALMWLRDYHMDGLRLDAVHAMFDHSAVHFLEQLTGEVDRLSASLGRPLVLIAESDLNDPRVVRPLPAGGFGMHAQWSDDFHHALHSLLTGEQSGYYADFGSMDDLAQTLTHVFAYNYRYSPFRGRTHGRPVADLPFHHFVSYLQNHDQIGNRATGERIHHTIPHQAFKLGAALLFSAPFIPLIFQGEEWAASTPFQFFTHHQSQELGDLVREGRRQEFAAFGWDPRQVPDPQSEQTFLASKLRWEEAEQEPHASMLNWYRALIRLRKMLPELSPSNREATSVVFDSTRQWLQLQRGPVTLICNFASEPRSIPTGPEPSTREILLASGPVDPGGGDSITLPAYGVCLLRETGSDR
jgi:maltooligosyltrehalose trehalohydrolase